MLFCSCVKIEFNVLNKCCCQNLKFDLLVRVDHYEAVYIDGL